MTTWMQTYTGRAFYPMDPRTEDVDIIDIAHALARICRFGGHCSDHYSVIEHSLLVEGLVHDLGGSHLDRLWGLMHDSAEAYTGDIIRPIKYSSPEVTAILKGMEDKCLEVIAEALELPLPIPPIVKRADEAALAVECRDLMRGERAGDWCLPECPSGFTTPRLHEEGEAVFLRRYRLLKKIQNET